MKNTKIGFFGVGNMGERMIANLLKCHYQVVVSDLDPAKCRIAAQLGAKIASDYAAYEDAAFIIFALPETQDVYEILFGATPLIDHLAESTILIDMGTGSPALTQRIAERLLEHGLFFLDAPVSGGVGKAGTGELSIIVGGSETAFKLCYPVFSALGKQIFHTGPSGSGQKIKLINNMLTGINLAALCEGLILGVKAGVDPVMLLDIINCSSGESYSSRVKIDNFVFKRNFKGGFRLKLQSRDLELATELADAECVPARFGELARTYYQEAIQAGYAEEDSSALIKLLESVTQTEVKKREETG